MGTDYQAQFDKAHSVLEITEANGFVILVEDLEDEISRVTDELTQLHEEARRAVTDRVAVDPNRYTQQVIALEAQLSGLRFISDQVEYYKRRKEEATKKLQ